MISNLVTLAFPFATRLQAVHHPVAVFLALMASLKTPDSLPNQQ
jgi:hypothetical protein